MCWPVSTQSRPSCSATPSGRRPLPTRCWTRASTSSRSPTRSCRGTRPASGSSYPRRIPNKTSRRAYRRSSRRGRGLSAARAIGLGGESVADVPGETRRYSVVVRGEPCVGDVHLAEAAVHGRRAVIEPAGDVLPVLARGLDRCNTVGRRTGAQQLGESLLDAVGFGLDPQPVLLRIGGRTSVGLRPRVGVAPPMFGLGGPFLAAVIGAEHFELLLGGERDTQFLCLHLVFDRVHQRTHPLDPLSQQAVLPA